MSVMLDASLSWKGNGSRGAHPYGGSDGNLPVVKLHDGVDGRHTQAAAVAVFRAERVENVIQHPRRHARSVISHRDDDRSVVDCYLCLDVTRFVGRFLLEKDVTQPV